MGVTRLGQREQAHGLGRCSERSESRGLKSSHETEFDLLGFGRSDAIESRVQDIWMCEHRSRRGWHER